jgi:exopolysaccharide biosynthesis polyprenyl glycosylphosphotransferase
MTPPNRSRARRLRTFRALGERVLAPVAGTIAVWLLAGPGSAAALVAALAFISAALIPAPQRSWASLLPLVKSPMHLIRPLVALFFLLTIQVATDVPALEALELLLVFGVSAATGLAPGVLMSRSWSAERAVRIAVIGSSRSAHQLAEQLRLAAMQDYEVVGRIAIEQQQSEEAASVPTLGALCQLKDLVAEHGVELLVMTGEVPRYIVFEEFSHSCLDLPVRVRLCELSSFCEEVFGYVPVAEINASWFQYIMHPKYRAGTPVSKRALDVTLGTLTALVCLPPLLLFALLIRRDGGPALFKQLRIGEGGQPFTVYKLRTMQVGSSAEWAVKNDDRVTRLGRFLRRMHLDELPQLINVLRGEMTIVGPRPEQPEIVELLEGLIPFYQRRHLLKPGLTGWAQVRCGYAGSEHGTAWKLAYDLYYLKHRSLAFDVAILAATIRTLFEHQHAVEPPITPFIQRMEASSVERSMQGVKVPLVARPTSARPPLDARARAREPLGTG